jgi:phosphoglycolate phosphatase-like HAD superfamily hydrolase
MDNATYLFRTMSDTVETDIARVHVVANEILSRYGRPPLSFAELRKIADGPFDLFLIPLIFPEEFARDRNAIFNENRRQEIRDHALEIAHRHGYDTTPPDLIPGIEASLRSAREAGLANVLITTGGRRFKHRAMEEQGLGGCFEEIIDRDQTYFNKEQGIYAFFRSRKLPLMRVILLSGTASYIKAGNNLEKLRVAGNRLEVFTVALASPFSYSDEETLLAARPKLLIHGLDELLPELAKRGLVRAQAPGSVRGEGTSVSTSRSPLADLE